MEGQKIIALRTVITLLKERSECEAELLAMAVNKIGDPNRKVASSASYLLHSQLLTKHPAMTMVVAKEVQNLAFRPHLSSRALYNCIIFLNQLRFSADISTSNNTSIAPTTTLPQQLVQTYFKLFEIAISSTLGTTTTTTKTNQKKKKNSGKSSKKQRKNHKAMGKTLSSSVSTSSTTEKIQSRLLCALLTGVNRARPFLPKSDQKMDQYVDYYFISL
jgi:ribosome biogenesis protein MAK21